MNLKRLLPLLIVPLLLTACPSGANRTKNGPDLRNLPREIRSGEQGPFHVQGIAVDLERGYIYFSFTTKLLKMDFEGNLIGSVDGMTGHLGCLTMNPADGRVYGSLEYKDDAIGKGIRRTLDAGQVAPEDEKDRTGFYVAIFDVDRITRPDMDAEKDRVMTTVYIKEAVDDYFATAENGGRTVEHRFGCSGIDGVTFAPRFGAKEGGDYLYVAYGVYGDTLRTDNDYQVLLAYDTKDWKRFEQPLSQGSLHKSGPAAPDHKYFVRTGNTSWGIQNLAYDPASGNCYAAVYKGKKSQYPNYSLFVIDGGKPARRELLQGFDTPTEGEVLSLVPAGKSAGGIYGWDFKWGTTDCVRSAAAISTFRRTPVRRRPNSRAAPFASIGGPAMRMPPSGRSNSPSPVVPCARPLAGAAGRLLVGCMRSCR